MDWNTSTNHLQKKLNIDDKTWRFLKYIFLESPKKNINVYLDSISPRDFLIQLQMLWSNDSQYLILDSYIPGEGGKEINLETEVDWEKVLNFFKEIQPRPDTLPMLCYRCEEISLTFGSIPAYRYRHTIYTSNLKIYSAPLKVRSRAVLFEYSFPFESDFTNIDNLIKYAMNFEDEIVGQIRTNRFTAEHIFDIYFGNRIYSTGLTKAMWKGEHYSHNPFMRVVY